MGDEEPYTDYECHFDQRDGTVGNLFVVGDIARSVRFDAVNNETSNYRMRVIEVGDDYIRLSGQYRSGNSVPQVGDTIVQYGNYTDEDRQNVIVRSVTPSLFTKRLLIGLSRRVILHYKYWSRSSPTARLTASSLANILTVNCSMRSKCMSSTTAVGGFVLG